MNISRRLGIKCFALKKAHADIAQFINNETLMKFSIAFASTSGQWNNKEKKNYKQQSIFDEPHQLFCFYHLHSDTCDRGMKLSIAAAKLSNKQSMTRW